MAKKTKSYSQVQALAVFSKIAGTVLGPANLAVAISGEDAQEVVNELHRRSAHAQ